MRWAVAVLALMLAGCFGSGSDQTLVSRSPTPTPPAPLECVGLVCLANPETPAARYVRETFGLRQLTEDPGGEPEFIVESPWIIIGRDYPGSGATGELTGDLYAYNLNNGTLIPIDQDQNSHAILPELVGDTVGFYYTKDGAGGPALWDFGNRTIQRLDTGVPGSHKSVGFDGTWVALRDGYSANETEDGYWAYNIHDHRRVFFYNPYPRTQVPDGSYETMVGVDVFNGTAVYILARATPENQPPKRYNSTIYVVNLETGEKREYFQDGLSVYRFSFDGRYVAMEANGAGWIFDLANGTLSPRERGCNFPSAGGGWVAFKCFEDGKGLNGSYNLILNPETGQRIKLQGHMSFQEIVTDGKYVVIKAHPNDEAHFTSFNLNLYWAPISELKSA